jgi:hypothetical protein
MSALTMLLGPAPEESLSHARTLQWPGGEQLHFQEDESAERIIVFSLPGVLRDTHWLADLQQPWRSVLKHGKYEDVERALTIAPDSGQVYLIDICARTALHRGMLEEFVADHIARHHEFRRLLDVRESSGEADNKRK